MSSEQQYTDLYQQCRELICRHSSDVMNAPRDRAFAAFKATGLPTRHEERYKYTNVAALFAPDYGLNLNRYPIPVNPYDAFRCDVPNLSTQLYFVVNDAFYPTERTQSVRESRSQDSGIVIGSLREQSSPPSPLSSLLSSHYGRLANPETDGVTALNTMLAQDGLLVYVPKGVKMDKAVQVVNILKAPGGTPPTPAPAGENAGGLMVNRRVLVILEAGAEAQLLFCDHAADDAPFLTTQVVEAYVGEGARLDLYCMEETHARSHRVSNVYIDQQANSRVRHNVITLHNGTTRNRLDLHLNGEGAECECNGCVIADKQQHIDNNTLITHHVPHCTSRELYKYVLDEQSTGAFAGRVLVEKGAQQTASAMRNQNLTATPEARMYTQPMLEIYADDVKCSHGSTVGQLNDAALFYMRQRGISEREAKLLLQQAFVTEVIDQIGLSPLRDRLRYLVDKRFRGELSHCRGCQLCR